MMPARADLVGLMVGAPLLIASNAMPWLTIGVLIVLMPLAMLRLLAARGSTRLAWPAIGILAMALVGTAVSPDRAVSLQKLSGIVVGVLALAAVQAHGRSAGGFAAATIVFVALATVAVAAGGAALLPAVTEMLPSRAALQRTVPAATVHPNGVAGLVLMVLPGLLLLVMSRAVWIRAEAALAPRYRTRWTRPMVLRAGAAALCLAMLATLVASRSRSGIVGLVAAIALALGLRLVAGRPSRRAWIAVSAALVAANLTIGAIAIYTGSRLSSDLATRVDIWNRAVMMIGAFPLTGVGLNAFRSLLPLVAPSPYMSPGLTWRTRTTSSCRPRWIWVFPACARTWRCWGGRRQLPAHRRRHEPGAARRGGGARRQPRRDPPVRSDRRPPDRRQGDGSLLVESRAHRGARRDGDNGAGRRRHAASRHRVRPIGSAR